jgi:hypothetical protein
MEQNEIDLCDKATKDLNNCVGCGAESFFGSYNGMGCDMLTYTFNILAIDTTN